MDSHAILAPSSAARRMACPGSRHLESKYPQEETEETKEGHAAHWLAAQALTFAEIPDRIAPNGVEITEEMIDGADLYQEAVMRVCSNLALLHVEEKVYINVIHAECWGTPDCWYYNPENRKLYIFDYKFGYRFVEVYENWQLLEYAAGVVHHLLLSQVDEIVLTIVQPRSFHPRGAVRSWALSFGELDNYADILREAEAKAFNSVTECNPTPECRDCRARFACPALQNAALAAVEKSYLNIPHELTPAMVGNELRLLKNAHALLEARITGLEEQAIHLLKAGERLPFFHLEPSLGRTRWTVPSEQIIEMAKLLDVDISKPAEALTPKQALNVGLSQEIVDAYSTTPFGGMKLTPDDLNKTRKLFK